MNLPGVLALLAAVEAAEQLEPRAPPGRGVDRPRRAEDLRRLSSNTSGSSSPEVEPPASTPAALRAAIADGMALERVQRLTQMDPWFLEQISELVQHERWLSGRALERLDEPALRMAKRSGFSDVQLAHLTNSDEPAVRARREELGVLPCYKTVDTCAAEFAAETPYFYSSYDDEDEAASDDERPRVMILGGGPNRIGQGIEFDCCCVHATEGLRESGYRAVMVNCNPETVSTDYDISDRLYFEPLTVEDVLEVARSEKPEGVIVQFGGATPLALSEALEAAGLPILGTKPQMIDLAEDRGRFAEMLDRLEIARPDYGMATSLDEAYAVARRLGYPVLVRPSYVLGGQAMAVCYDESRLADFIEEATQVGEGRPVLLDRFLEDAVEVDVDAIADGDDVVICGVMQHLEQAGIHSGDSTAVLPPYKVDEAELSEIRRCTEQLARELQVCGLMNVQYAIADGKVHVLEANPRASRTVPFLSKALRIPFAKLAAQVMVGAKLKELGLTEEPKPDRFAIKVPVFPFDRFAGFDPVLPAPRMGLRCCSASRPIPTICCRCAIATSTGRSFCAACTPRTCSHVLAAVVG